MNTEQLHANLVRLEIPHWTYQLYDGPIDDRLVLEERKGKWLVYFSERGGKHNLSTFDSEPEACDHFFEMAKKYLTRK
ncbi:hypothetical protein [Ekhidna sp.]|uniref:hypothetical protein n=1 Tax=Ekhidna sp. TaxID=2608089 RepID=UPI003512C8B7